MTVDILIAGVDLDSVGAKIITGIVLLISVSVQDVFAGVDIM